MKTLIFSKIFSFKEQLENSSELSGKIKQEEEGIRKDIRGIYDEISQAADTKFGPKIAAELDKQLQKGGESENNLDIIILELKQKIRDEIQEKLKDLESKYTDYDEKVKNFNEIFSQNEKSFSELIQDREPKFAAFSDEIAKRLIGTAKQNRGAVKTIQERVEKELSHADIQGIINLRSMNTFELEKKTAVTTLQTSLNATLQQMTSKDPAATKKATFLLQQLFSSYQIN